METSNACKKGKKEINFQIWLKNFIFLSFLRQILNLLEMVQGAPLRHLTPFETLPYDTENYRNIWHTLKYKYGGLHRQRSTLFRTIDNFGVIKKFNQENVSLLESLITRIQQEFQGELHMGSQGEYLNDRVKQLIPEQELRDYFKENGRTGKEDTFVNLSSLHWLVSHSNCSFSYNGVY